MGTPGQGVRALSVIVLRGVAVVFACGTLLFGACLAPYAGMEFNSEGRYFDPKEDVVYHEEERGFFAFCAVTSALFAGSAFAAARLVARKLEVVTTDARQ